VELEADESGQAHTRVMRVSKRFRASVSGTAVGLRGTRALLRAPSCKRYRSDGTNDGPRVSRVVVTLTDHEKEEEEEEGDEEGCRTKK